MSNTSLDNIYTLYTPILYTILSILLLAIRAALLVRAPYVVFILHFSRQHHHSDTTKIEMEFATRTNTRTHTHTLMRASEMVSMDRDGSSRCERSVAVLSDANFMDETTTEGNRMQSSFSTIRDRDTQNLFFGQIFMSVDLNTFV